MINNKHKILICFIGIFLLSFISRYNILSNYFVLDDFILVINNSFIHSLNNLADILNPQNLFYVLPVKCGARPLTVASFIIDYSIYGSAPFGYHLFNLILHCFNSFLVFLFILYLKKDSLFFSLIGALFYSLHPVQTEAVSVISFRADLLLSFFYLITLNLLNILRFLRLNGRFKKTSIYLLIGASICCAFFSKENAVVLPVVILLFSIFLYKNTKLIKFSYISFFAIVILFFFFWVERFPVPLYSTIYPNLHGNISPLSGISSYFNTIITSLFYNVAHIVYPVNLSVDYTVVFSKYITLAMIFFIIFSLIIIIKIKDKYIKFSIFLLMFTYLPVSNIVPLVNTVADRYMYFPMVAISVLFALLIKKLSQYVNMKFIYCFVISLCVINIAISYQCGQAYNNQYSLYYDAVSKNPDNIRTLYNMGVSYFYNGEYDKSIIELNKVIKINPLYMRDKIWFFIAMSYDKSGQQDIARQYYYKSFLLNPFDKGITSKFIASFISFDEAIEYVLSHTVRINDNIYLSLRQYQDK